MSYSAMRMGFATECVHCHAIKNKIKNHEVDINSRNCDITDDK